MLQDVRIVLVETSHTGNMGSVARAMKIVELTNLWLINPLAKPDSQAIALATGVSGVVGNAHIINTLNEALAGYSPVVGVSARSHTLPQPMLDPRECGLKSVAKVANTLVALMFGCERVDLINRELQKCRCHVAIAVNPEYGPLSLAMAAQVITYKVCMAWLTTQENDGQAKHEETPYPPVDDLERLYGHSERTLLATGFIRENHLGQVMNKLCRLFIHVRPESQESNILREILASIEQRNKGDKAEQQQLLDAMLNASYQVCKYTESQVE